VQGFLIGIKSISSAKPARKATSSEADSQPPLASQVAHQQEEPILESEIILRGTA
jgi:hypothetical protein